VRRIDAAVLAGVALAAASAHAAYGPIPFDLDTGFGSSGISRAGLPVEFTPRRLYVAPNGSIYSLTVGAAAGELQHYVSKRGATGTLDLDFGVGGTVTHTDAAMGDQTYLGLCVDPANGALYLTGATEGEDAFIVRRFLADGSPDDGWGAAGLLSVPLAGGPAPYAQGCAVQGDGKLIVVGSWSALNADDLGVVNRAFIARLTTTGALDDGFGDAGVHAIAPDFHELVQLHYALTQVEVDSQGAVYVGGHTTDPRNLGRDVFFAKVTASGQAVRPYGERGAEQVQGPAYNDQVAGIRVNPGGTLVAAVLHGTLGAAGFSMTTLRLTAQGVLDITYGCVGKKAGPVELMSVAPSAAAIDGAGAALFLGREPDAEVFESVVRNTGLPELAIGGSSGEEIAHGCLPYQGPHEGGSTLPATLVVLGLLAALRGLRRR
jgi:uncharacterized delta-60 repeat protein